MRPLRLLFLPVALMVLAVAAVTVPLPVFLEQPGELLSLGENVHVESNGDTGELDGDFLLTVVTLERATVVGMLGGLFDDSVELAPVDRVTGGVDQEVFFERQQALFRAATDIAAAVGQDAAGLDVEPEDLKGEGALVMQTVGGAAADGVLRPGDVITAVDGESVGSGDELVEAVEAATGTATVTYRRDDAERRADIELGPVAGREEPGLGVAVQTAPGQPELPVPVEVSSGRIGGPSAGLMIALTVFDKAADVNLAGGRRIAGTGGIGPTGAVESVGGVRQKVLAAARADVSVFLVPADQLESAREARPSDADLELVGAATFDEAVEALRREPAVHERPRPRLSVCAEPWTGHCRSARGREGPWATHGRTSPPGLRVRLPNSPRTSPPVGGSRSRSEPPRRSKTTT